MMITIVIRPVAAAAVLGGVKTSFFRAAVLCKMRTAGAAMSKPKFFLHRVEVFVTRAPKSRTRSLRHTVCRGAAVRLVLALLDTVLQQCIFLFLCWYQVWLVRSGARGPANTRPLPGFPSRRRPGVATHKSIVTYSVLNEDHPVVRSTFGELVAGHVWGLHALLDDALLLWDAQVRLVAQDHLYRGGPEAQGDAPVDS